MITWLVEAAVYSGTIL